MYPQPEPVTVIYPSMIRNGSTFGLVNHPWELLDRVSQTIFYLVQNVHQDVSKTDFLASCGKGFPNPVRFVDAIHSRIDITVQLVSLPPDGLSNSLTMKKLFELYQKIDEKVVTLFTIAVKLLAIPVIIIIGYRSIDGLFQESFNFQPFDVPQAFVDNGLNGNFTAWQLSDEIGAIQDTGWSVSGFNVTRQQADYIEEDIVLFGVSVNTLKSLVRNLLGIEDKAVRGSLVTRGNKLYLKIDLHDAKSIVLIREISDSSDIYHTYDQILRDASIEVLHEIDPFILASYHWAKKDDETCLKIIKEIIADQRESHDSAYLLWGEILGKSGKYIAAIEKYQKSVELNPDNGFAWNGWGWTLAQMGRDEDALPKFEEATDLIPDLWHGWYQWGVVLYRNKRYTECIEKLEKAIAVDPTQVVAYNEVSYAYAASNNLQGAIESLNRGIQSNPEEGILYATLAEMYWRQDQKQLAYESLQMAMIQGFDVYLYAGSEPYKSFAEMFPKRD